MRLMRNLAGWLSRKTGADAESAAEYDQLLDVVAQVTAENRAVRAGCAAMYDQHLEYVRSLRTVVAAVVTAAGLEPCELSFALVDACSGHEVTLDADAGRKLVRVVVTAPAPAPEGGESH